LVLVVAGSNPAKAEGPFSSAWLEHKKTKPFLKAQGSSVKRVRFKTLKGESGKGVRTEPDGKTEGTP